MIKPDSMVKTKRVKVFCPQVNSEVLYPEMQKTAYIRTIIGGHRILRGKPAH